MTPDPIQVIRDGIMLNAAGDAARAALDLLLAERDALCAILMADACDCDAALTGDEHAPSCAAVAP